MPAAPQSLHRQPETSPRDARLQIPRLSDRDPPSGIGAAVAFFVRIGLCLVVGGFLAFTSRVAGLQPSGIERADGIVVLTGGRERIRGAIDLLRAGRGQRLLITGVHQKTREADLARADETPKDLFRCCIDLGFEAETTIGNAREASEWAHAHGFKSLIVVTSAYHLPRSLTEFQAALPDITLEPYPIHHAELDLAHWYLSADASKLLMGEYVKYTVARMRALLLPAPVN